MPPEDAGWRSVAVETEPLAERIQTALGPCCENDIIFDATSCTRTKMYKLVNFMIPQQSEITNELW